MTTPDFIGEFETMENAIDPGKDPGLKALKAVLDEILDRDAEYALAYPHGLPDAADIAARLDARGFRIVAK